MNSEVYNEVVRPFNGYPVALGLGLGTVRNHLKRVFDKMGAHSQAAVVALARGFTKPRG